MSLNIPKYHLFFFIFFLIVIFCVSHLTVKVDEGGFEGHDHGGEQGLEVFVALQFAFLEQPNGIVDARGLHVFDGGVQLVHHLVGGGMLFVVEVEHGG